MSDVHPCHLWKHRFEERGQTVAFTYAAGQKWYYLDGHGVDEVTMIKIWDNDKNVIGKCKPPPKCYSSKLGLLETLTSYDRQFVRTQHLNTRSRRLMRCLAKVWR